MRANICILMAVINYIVGIKRFADYCLVLFPAPSISPELAFVFFRNQFLEKFADFGKLRMRCRLSTHDADSARKALRKTRDRLSQRNYGLANHFQIHFKNLFVVPYVTGAV